MTIKTALAYDDVLLVPQKSSIKSRQDVDTSAKLSKNITLKIPIVSSNMDTVTESRMAIAMALAGGIGFIHRFCDIDKQVKEVTKVKRKQNIIIEKPFTIRPDDNLAKLKKKVQEHNCHSFLVSEGGHKLQGIITSRDIVLIKDDTKLVSDVMTPRNNLITADKNISIAKARELLNNNKIEKLPLVDKNFNIQGLITSTDII